MVLALLRSCGSCTVPAHIICVSRSGHPRRPLERPSWQTQYPHFFVHAPSSQKACRCFVGVRGSPERDISSLRALGPGGGQISRVVHVSTRADFGVFAEKYGFV